MQVNPRPTRAEVSDVANAVLDGADCVMLSGETAKGKYPLEAVRMMAETAYVAESAISYAPLFDQLRALTPRPTETAETLALAAVAASIEQDAGAIIVLSTSGVSARLIAKYRPSCPIICGELIGLLPQLTPVTRKEQTARQLHLSRGVYPVWYPEPRGVPPEKWQIDVDNRIRFGLKSAVQLAIVKPEATVIAVQGWKGGLGHVSYILKRIADNRPTPCVFSRCRPTPPTSRSRTLSASKPKSKQSCEQGSCVCHTVTASKYLGSIALLTMSVPTSEGAKAPQLIGSNECQRRLCAYRQRRGACAGCISWLH